MKRSLVALSLLGLALTGCSDDQSGEANPDSQVEQPPLPGESIDDTGGRSQGPTPEAS